MMCPRVVIPRDTAYLTQIVNYREEFQISLVGYEGHCYFDTRVNRDKAVINPVFKIKRLRRSDETSISPIIPKPSKGRRLTLAKRPITWRLPFPRTKRK